MRRSFRGRRGFTLVEVILALGIFAVLAGAIFAAVQAVSNASAILGVEQLRARKTDALLSWMRQGFRALPARAEVVLRTRDSGAGGLAVELIIRRAPGAFGLGEFDAAGADLVLGAIPDGRGGATLQVARFPGTWTLDELSRNLRREDWLPLFEGIRTLRWSFWSPEEKRFFEEWPEGSGRPVLVRLQMTLASGEEIEAVFRPPNLVFRGEGGADNDPDPSPGDNNLELTPPIPGS
jgi:prepilin-type N-terminal cleavage/methylation domain-containing protein